MTAEERQIAAATLQAGPWESHDQIVIAVADRLDVDSHHVEAVLQRLRVRMVLVCVSATRSRGESPVRYERGGDWVEE